jgi:hypothetical protein
LRSKDKKEKGKEEECKDERQERVEHYWRKEFKI